MKVSMQSLRVSRLVAVAAVLVLAACSDEPATSPAPAPLPVLTITPPGGDVYEGDVVRFVPTLRRTGEGEIPSTDVQWTVDGSAESWREVDGTLTVMPLTPGALRVVGRVGEISATQSITVKRLMVEKLTLSRSQIALAVGDSIPPLGVLVQGAGGRAVPGRVVQFTSSDVRVAVVTAAGFVRAVAPGAATITATADGVAAAAAVTVGMPTQEYRLAAVNSLPVPALAFVDSVEWDGAREEHEGYYASGTLRIEPSPVPRYQLSLKVEEFAVHRMYGEVTRTLRLRQSTNDFGRWAYAWPGQSLELTSDWVVTFRHTLTYEGNAVRVRFRQGGGEPELELRFVPVGP